jgi:hypothetical protein
VPLLLIVPEFESVPAMLMLPGLLMMPVLTNSIPEFIVIEAPEFIVKFDTVHVFGPVQVPRIGTS